MFDPSLQAQFLIPMAVSMGFGIMFATVITLYLIPCTLLIADDVSVLLNRAVRWYFAPLRRSQEDSVQEVSHAID
jgi:hypothetical protein